MRNAPNRFQPAKQYDNGLVLGGCGIAYAIRLPKPLSESVMTDARTAGMELPETKMNTGPLRLVREMLEKMSLRTNGEGAGIAFKRETSSLHEQEGFPLDYAKDQANMFTVFAFTYEKEDANKLKTIFKENGFEVKRSRQHEARSGGRDVTKGSEVVEFALVVRPEREYQFVQLCNKINASDGPKIYSAGVGTGLIKIVGRPDELYGAFPSVFDKDRRYGWALGHGRYPTNVPDAMTASQPHCGITYNDRGIFVTYSSQNGEITNNDSLRTLMKGVRHFHLSNIDAKIATHGRDGIASMLTASDGESIPHVTNYLHSRGLNLDQIGRTLGGDMVLPFGNGMWGMSGPVSVISHTTDGTLAFKDKRRLRPLQAGLASDGKSAYVLIASEEGAMHYAIKRNGLTPLSFWAVRDRLAIENGVSADGLKKIIPPIGTGMFHEEKERFAPSICTNVKLEIDVEEIRKGTEKLSLSELFRRRLLPGDNGKCFDERETYIQREIAFAIREKIAAIVAKEMQKQGGRDSIELDIHLSNLSGERHLCVGVFNYLKKEIGLASLPANLKINWYLQGALGDNVGAFCGPGTKIVGFGNGGETNLNTARGADYTLHGSNGSSFMYGASAGTVGFVKENIGPRGGAYMKGTLKASPLLVVGGTADKYFCESAHMGTAYVLNKNNEAEPVGVGLAAGIEGKAKVIARGESSHELPEGVAKRELTDEERREMEKVVQEYCKRFGLQDRLAELASGPFFVYEKAKGAVLHPFVPVVPPKDGLIYPEAIQKEIYTMAGGEGKDHGWNPKYARGVLRAKGMGYAAGAFPLNAAMVTAPPVDNREDINIRKMLKIPIAQQNVEGQTFEEISNLKNGCYTTGITFGSISRGSISEGAWRALYEVANELEILVGTGEGGLPRWLKSPSKFLTRQVASGRFGLNTDDPTLEQDYFENALVIEIKIAQGAKPGKGGTLGPLKVTAEIADMRGIEAGTPAVSPPTHHDVYSIEDVKKLIELLRMVGGGDVKIAVKIAATNDIEQIGNGLVKGNANIINIAGSEGGTGFATLQSNATGISGLEGIERIHNGLVKSGLRNYVTLEVSGGFWNGHGIVRAYSLGANVVEMGTAPLIAMGCNQCQMCTGPDCHVGLTSVSDDNLQEHAHNRLKTYVFSVWNEVKDILQQNGVTELAHATGNANLMVKDRHSLVYVHPSSLQSAQKAASPTPVPAQQRQPLPSLKKNDGTPHSIQIEMP